MNSSIKLIFIYGVYLFGTNTSMASVFESLGNGHVAGEVHNILSVSSTPKDALREAGIDSSAKAGASGLSLSYLSDDFQGWFVGGRLQFGVDWDLHDNDSGSSLVGGEDDIRITIDGLNLQNLYIKYNFNQHGSNTQLTIGRQDIISPLIMRSALFPMMDAFEGLVITNNDYSKTKVELMLLDGWFRREKEFYDSLGSLPQRMQFSKPILSLYLNSSAINFLTLEAQWLSNDNDELIGDPPTTISPFGGYEVFYLAADYEIVDSLFTLGGQYNVTHYKDNNNTNFFGIRGRLDAEQYSLEVSYSKNSDKANSPGTLGHVPWLRSYNFSMSVNDIYAGVSTINSKLIYNFGIENLVAIIKYSWISQSFLGQMQSGRNLDNAKQLSFDFRYRFVKSEDWSLRLELAHTAYNNEFDDNDFLFSRLAVKYKF